MSIDAQPLDEALKLLAKSQQISIFLDRRGLKGKMIDPASPVTYRPQGQTLEQALKSILGPLKLQAIIRNEVLFVTPESANGGT